jgi:3-phenylpropionate/trans-cinnamate dioxygenase ferredoxin reductase component
MYIIIVGAGKVGWNLARELINKEHEVTLIESNRRRYLTVEQELEHNIQYGDASELWVLERAGIQRADMVIAVTGDDEDNMLICQVAREKYMVDRIIARVNNPRNLEHFELLGIKPSVSATGLILNLIEHEVPEYGLVHLLDFPEERLEIIEMLLEKDSRVAGQRVGDLDMPEGSLLISVLREGRGFVPGPETVLEPGDEILAVLDPGREEDLKVFLGGFASGHCATELRKRGAEGEILLVGREPEVPYERPPLSKEYMRGESQRSDAYVHPASWYEENDVELLTGRNVMSLDTAERSAKLQGGDEVRFEKALLATGANVNILRVEGAENEGIHYLRAFGNTEAIRKDAEKAEHVVLIGGSYIGSEVAASLTATGTKCTIVMMEEVLLSNHFGEEAGRFFHDLVESHGIEILGGESLQAFEGDGRVKAVVTASGKQVECDAVVVGAGVRPDVMLAQKAGLEVDDGITCDAKLQTSVEGIYAAGDVCSYDSVIHGRRLRVEHWDVALQQGQAAGANMLGEGKDYDVVPYFFSDLADWASLEYVGPAEDWDEIVWRGERDSGEFSAWYLKDGKVAGCLSVERSEDLARARELLAEGTDVSADRKKIADPGTDLGEIG